MGEGRIGLIFEMNPGVVLIISTSVQVAIYLYCIIWRKNYIDFAVYGLAIICNFWLFPMIFQWNVERNNCQYDNDGLGQLFFWFFANAISTVLYLIYRFVRWLVERNTNSTPD